MVLIVAALPVGMLFGAVPGLGGKLAIVLMIPVVFGMDPVPGAVFLLAMHAVVHTGGSIPSILFGIPGTGPDAATIVDGFPMTKRGEAGRALGASLAASGLGGVVGALVLALLLPALRPIVLAFGPPEFFLLALLGIAFITMVSGASLLKGLIVGCLGLMLAFVGMDPQTGIARYSFGQLFLWDGIDTVTAIVALFAVPEMVALGARGGALSTLDRAAAGYGLGQVLNGMADVFRHRWLALRTSVIGALIGVVPGLGGDAASWICYGHAVQSAREPERFGHGAVEGVIAPETANNAKEGGALLPTLSFGVPGSSGMALLLGAFAMLGIVPGPRLLTEGGELITTLIWALALANVLAVAVFLLIARWFGLLAFVRGELLVPAVFALALLGGYLSGGTWRGLVLMLLLSVVGWGLWRYDWPRPPFVIGFVLGGVAEVALHKSLAIWGPAFVLRPGALTLLACIAATLGLYAVRRRSARHAVSKAAADGGDVIVSAVLLALFTGMVALACGYPPDARLLPLVIGLPAIVLSAAQLAAAIRHRATAAADWRGVGNELVLLGWFAAFVAGVIAGGFLVGGPLLVFAFLLLHAATGWRTAAAVAAGCAAVLHGLFERLLGLPLFPGLLG